MDRTDEDRPRVWALSKGEYSDYRVVAIFATKAQAEAAARTAKRTPLGFQENYYVEPLPFFAEDGKPGSTSASAST